MDGLSRRQFLVRTGSLAVGFALAPSLVDCDGAYAQRARGGSMIDSWIRINADETVTVLTGKMELGQGIRTALAQIAAEELDVSVSRVSVVVADTGRTPDEGITAGSMSIENSGSAIRQAAAEARQALLEMASEKLGVPADRLVVSDGQVTIRDSDESVTYWQLLDGKQIQHKVTGNAKLKNPDEYEIVGKPVGRLELPEIVTGRYTFLQDLRFPNMVHARVLRPPGYGATLRSLPREQVEGMPGVVKLVEDGSFVAVVAEREEQAVFALDVLREQSKWDEPAELPSAETLYDHLRALPMQDSVIREQGDAEGALKSAKRTMQASYRKPYIMHASAGPSCSVALWEDDRLTIWSHSQGVYPLRQAISGLLEMPAEKIRIVGVPGAGCYGHNGADDVAADAALIARAVPGRHVRLQWMRFDEHAWEPYGSAMMLDLRGGLDDRGNIVAWEHRLWSDTHSTRPGGDPASLLPSWHLNKPREIGRRGWVGGAARNSEPIYDFPNQKVTGHVFRGPIRVSALRSLGAYANIFALESFMDELAHAAGADPVEFRLRHLSDQRGIAVIRAAADAAGWGRVLSEDRGLGIAFARYKNSSSYCAVCAEVEADPAGPALRVLRLTAAIDAGQVINPDGLKNQTEGGMIQAASWTLKEQVRFDRKRITSTGWETYPILRFDEAPRCEVVVIDRPDEKPMGAGESAQGPTPAAIANAVFAACGKRVRDLPLTPEKLR